MEAPLINALQSQNIVQSHPFFGFSDSTWNDDVDTGRSTGCFIIAYMGGVVDHSSNMPDPVTLSSAEAEYNEGCVAFMAASHLRTLLCELKVLMNQRYHPLLFSLTVRVLLPCDPAIKMQSTLDTFKEGIIMLEKT